MSLSVGIDLGTTFTAISYVDKMTGVSHIIPNKYGNNTTPSVLAFLEDGTILYGDDAVEKEKLGCLETASFYKLYMGNKNFSVSFWNKVYTAEDLSAIFLTLLIKDTEKIINQKIDKAVITVPAYFMAKEREATKRAGEKANLEIIGIINEPTAAIIAYGIKNDIDISQNILVYDLGGGTFDVTIAQVTATEINVLASNGDHELGGKDWDMAIVEWLNEQFYSEFFIDISENLELSFINMVLAEKAKKQLSVSSYADIDVYYDGKHGKYRLTETVMRELTSYLMEKTKFIVQNTFDDINISWNDIDGVVLVGGSTKMKMVRDYVKEMTGKAPFRGVNPDECVAVGAGIRANMDNNGKCIGTLKTISRSLPSYSKKTDSFLIGAKKIHDVTAHSLSMVSINQDRTKFIKDVMIPKNSKIPFKRIKKRSLKVSKNMLKNELEIYLLQGESIEPYDCTVAKKFVFYNIPYINGGTTNLNIEYAYNENAIINISAKQLETNIDLKYREEPVPDDMSWLLKSPDEVYGVKKNLNGEIYLALDVSGSMSGSVLSKAKSAMIDFVNQIDTDCIRIGISIFADKDMILLKSSNNKSKIVETILNIEISSLCGYCNSAEPFNKLFGVINKNKDIKYIIVLTDGIWETDACIKAICNSKKCNKNEIETVALGFGSADMKFLKEISSQTDLAKFDNISMLQENLSKIAQVINND